jgi:hypothetical protein
MKRATKMQEIIEAPIPRKILVVNVTRGIPYRRAE